jgi:transcriptional regulator with XRE-family HTH domain
VFGVRTAYIVSMSKLSDLIRDARKRKGKEWTQEFSAEQSGLSRSWFAQIETGKIETVNVEFYDALARHLGITPIQILKAQGMLPEDTPDPMAEFLRIEALPTLDQRIEAVKSLSPELYRVVEAVALGLVQQNLGLGRGQSSATGGQ